MHLDRGAAPRGQGKTRSQPSKSAGIALPLARDPNGRDAEARIRELEDEVSDLRAELLRSERRVDAMKQIGRALGSNLEIEPLLGEIVSRTTELLEADRSTLFLIDRARGELHSKVIEGKELREIRLPIGVGLAGWVAASGEPLHIKNAYADQRFNPEVDKKSGYRTRSVLVWPVRAPRGDAVVGVIQVLNKRTGPFDATDERLLEAIASEIGVGLEVARLYGEAIERNAALERTRSELMLLIETERAISDSQDPSTLLRTILETARNKLSARGALLYLLDDRGVDLELAVTSGITESRIAKFKPSPSDPILSEAMLGAKPVLKNDVEGLARGRVRVRRILAAPIISKAAGTLGVIELVGKRGRAVFTSEDATTLAVVASQAGRAITAERERADRERAERLTTIGRMLSGVVHDLRTPLTLISGHAELMAGSDDDDERQQHARAVAKQVELMTAMTKDLLAFARGERSVLIRKVYVERFMAEMDEYLTREFAGTGVKLELKVGCKGTARFDETKLLRVFHNIARNAREAMPGGGRFTVSLNRVGGDLVFEFADTGAGIAKAVEGKVFEPFVTSGKTGGTGLGLAMVKRIAEEHRGSVSYDSQPGRGTRFFFTIPVG